MQVVVEARRAVLVLVAELRDFFQDGLRIFGWQGRDQLPDETCQEAIDGLGSLIAVAAIEPGKSYVLLFLPA